MGIINFLPLFLLIQTRSLVMGHATHPAGTAQALYKKYTHSHAKADCLVTALLPTSYAVRIGLVSIPHGRLFYFHM